MLLESYLAILCSIPNINIKRLTEKMCERIAEENTERIRIRRILWEYGKPCLHGEWN